MKEYVLSVAGVALISSIFSMVLPNGNLSKFSYGILRLCCVMTILTPIVGVVDSLSDYFSKDTTTTSVIKDEVVESSFAVYNEKLEKDLKDYIFLNYNLNSTVQVAYYESNYTYNIEKIVIYFKQCVLNESEMNKYKTEIKSFICDTLGVEQGDIYVNVKE